jgi:hypothetical protein
MPYTSFNLADAKQRLLDRVGSSVFWTPAEAGAAFNEAICVWQALVGEWTSSLDLPVTSGNYYNVPRQIISVQRVKWNNTSLTLGSQEEWDYGKPGWEGVTGTPEEWAPLGLSMIAISPAPTTGIITFEGYKEAPILSSDGEFFDLGDEYLSDFLGYGQHVLCFKEGTTEQSNSQSLYQQFVKAAGDQNSALRAMNVYKNAMGLPRDESERSGSSQPSIGARL